MQKDRKKIGSTFFSCFLIFEAVWRSHNLERVYIFLTKAVLRPPCRRCGKSVTKKIDNLKILDMCFFVFQYSKLFGAHATLNVCIYFQKKLFYGHPVGDTEVAPLQKR